MLGASVHHCYPARIEERDERREQRRVVRFADPDMKKKVFTPLFYIDDGSGKKKE